MGRPSFPGNDTTFTINEHWFEVITQGSDSLAKQDGRAMNRSAWIRLLIDYALDGKDITLTITPDDLSRSWDSVSPLPESKRKATIRLEDNHLILLRQFECHAQSLNWTLPLHRNEALQLLIALYGPALNQSLK